MKNERIANIVIILLISVIIGMITVDYFMQQAYLHEREKAVEVLKKLEKQCQSCN